MQTTDGHELIQNSYYYLEDGQTVILNEGAITPDGKQVYLVSPLYEGTAMRASGDGGYHHEITCDYEHEGPQTLVHALFKKAPTEKLDADYKEKLNQIERLSLTIGTLKQEEKVTRELIASLDNAKKDVEKLYDVKRKALTEITAELDNMDQTYKAIKQKISEMEDSLTSTPAGNSTSISITELQRLNKRDFRLSCLENGGVDNWHNYDDSLDNYRARYPED